MWVCVKWVAKVKKSISFSRVEAFVLTASRRKQNRARHYALPVKCRTEKETRLTGNTEKPMDCALIVEQDHSNTA